MKIGRFLFGALMLGSSLGSSAKETIIADKFISKKYEGSKSCRECHGKFYELWSTSHHGLAMQPFTQTFAKEALTPMTEPLVVSGESFIVTLGDKETYMTGDGDDHKKRFPFKHVLGGKNVYFFLTPLEKGRLQVMPIAYDVMKKEWYHTTQSMVRHALDDDQALEWKDPLLTFNTACYSCHVSQLNTNYDLETDTYNTTWEEPGINCETCHGPAEEHERIAREALAKGELPKEMGLVVTGDFTPKQQNDACNICHAKATNISDSYKPGEKFFDHYRLTTFEDPDFYADGRDLGENYTMTNWLMNECVLKSKMDCVDCHTSSGRYRFKEKDFNKACMPCHEDKVSNPSAHTFHKADSEASKCVSCHMPMTSFGRMVRSDHSLRPPSPSATIEFGSPNACNICHDKETPEWADKHVRKWKGDTFQDKTLEVGRLIKPARENDWSHIDKVLEYMQRENRKAIVVSSLLRLISSCNDERKWPVIELNAKHESPLVRSAAVSALRFSPRRESFDLIKKAAADDIRVVRLAAAEALLEAPRSIFSPAEQKAVDASTEELLTSYRLKLDNWTSHYNIGNYHMAKGNIQDAAKSYERSVSFRSDVLMPWMNLAITYARQGDSAKAESALRSALKVEPNHAGAHFNLGLLLAEMKKHDEAIKELRLAVQNDPMMGNAAHNLGIILMQRDNVEGLTFLDKAVKAEPSNPNYNYNYAYYLSEKGRAPEALAVLKAYRMKSPLNLNNMMFEVRLLVDSGKKDDAIALVVNTMNEPSLPAQQKQELQNYLQFLKSNLK